METIELGHKLDTTIIDKFRNAKLLVV